jgi:hypothetical protein
MAAIPVTPLAPRALPTPSTLADAVQTVIASNRADGYQPKYFARMTKNVQGAALVAVCSKLINQPNLQKLTAALNAHPLLLTIEDLIDRYGASWGFNGATIQDAHANSSHFDAIVSNVIAGGHRYV